MYKFILLIVTTFCLSSCVVNVKDHGYDREQNNFSQLKINQSTKEDVLNTVGSPSTTGTFNNNSWYYVSVKTKKISVLNPEVTEHLVTKLTFDNNEVLSDISVVDSKNKKSLKFNESASPIKGHTSGPIRDFFYNVGRYNKNEKGRK